MTRRSLLHGEIRHCRFTTDKTRHYHAATRAIQTDIIEYLPQYRIILCKRCKYAIRLLLLARHLRRLHMRDSPLLASESLMRTFVHSTIPNILTSPLLDPVNGSLILPDSGCAPFEHLDIY